MATYPAGVNRERTAIADEDTERVRALMGTCDFCEAPAQWSRTATNGTWRLCEADYARYGGRVIALGDDIRKEDLLPMLISDE